MAFADGEHVDICKDCAADAEASHKYEGVYAMVLDKMADLGMEDDYMSSDGWGYCGKFDNWLLYNDTQGSVTTEEFKTAELAQKHFDRLHDEGWGYSEDDASIYKDRGVYNVYFGGKELARIIPGDNYFGDNPLRRAKAMISLEMRRQGWYPNVWLGDDYSNRRIDVW
jgi:hypothetical protein